MRWPIQIQLLLPMLLVVVLAIVLSSGAGEYLGGARARQQQEEELARVVDTLAQASFPLSQQVLRQMSGLSGAEFVLLDREGDPRDATLAAAADEIACQGPMPKVGDRGAGQLATGPRLSVGGQTYLSNRVALARSRATPQRDSLLVLYPEERWSAVTRRAAFPALAAGAVAIAVAVAVTTFLAQRFVRPIKRLGGQVADIAGGDFQAAGEQLQPVSVSRRNDEIRDLAVSINRMYQRLGQYEEEIRRSERLRTLGQLGAGMAHQLRNAATGARMAIELHQRDCGAESDTESLQVALRQLELMESYLQRFLALGRPGSSVQRDMVLQKIVEDVLALVHPACKHAKIELAVRCPPEPIRLRGDPESLRQLLVNLVLNAVEAAERRPGAAPCVAIELERRGDHASLRVKDTGPGPDEALAERIFEPFVTGKPEGTGLGLCVARQTAEAHRGTITWCREGGMTCFDLELPIA